MKTNGKLGLLVLLLVSGFIVSAQQHPTKCGIWRWDVKTLTDKNGLALLSKTPIDATIDKMVLKKPSKVLHSNSKTDGKTPRYSNENQVVKIIAYVTEVKSESDDSDLHFILKSTDSENTMVGEIPDPTCPTFDKFPTLREHFTKTRSEGNAVWDKLKKSKKPVKVTITGVPFWDGEHSNEQPSGASKYFREIHPILSIEIIK